MKKNKTLSIIAVAMVPFVVISFVFKKDETNFHMNEFFGPEIPKVSEEVTKDKVFSVKVLVNGETETMNLEEYVVGVVAGEMPASFEMEALKAQAIASRTYALYRKTTTQSDEYDLTDNTNTQVYLTIDAMKRKWGDDFQKYYDRVRSAVEATRGKVITYSGKVIEAFYFAMSGGYTQEAGYVFNENRDYLKSVESVYDNSDLKNYEVATEFERQNFKNKLNLTCEDLTVGDIKRNDRGYVETLTVCGKSFKGTHFRTLLGLRSTHLDIEIGEKVKIITKGYGHGVGMSQYGANGYAQAGYTFEDIIKHYYTDVEIRDIKDV